ncbi:MAG: hypothetical protein IKT50_05985, partial [Clostridia bacterium]|nr:hypothetical protein [Clostridia bacterium]
IFLNSFFPSLPFLAAGALVYQKIPPLSRDFLSFFVVFSFFTKQASFSRLLSVQTDKKNG